MNKKIETLRKNEEPHYRYEIGKMYADGSDGVAQDINNAIKWWLLEDDSADSFRDIVGYKSQNALGDCYYYGNGVKRDTLMAVAYWKKSAKSAPSSYPDPCYKIGKLFKIGYFGEDDHINKAINWIRLAVKDNESCVELGDIYMDGEGVDKDIDKAIIWYKEAAERGHAVAQSKLGDIYHNQNIYYEAMKWFKESAIQGNREGMFGYGKMILNGEDCTVNIPVGESYIRAAAQLGHPKAMIMVVDFEKEFSFESEYSDELKSILESAKDGNYDSIHKAAKMMKLSRCKDPLANEMHLKSTAIMSLNIKELK